MNWHADPEVLDRYATRPESIDDTTASSIEQHLLTCDACRAALASAASPDVLEASWLAVADVIDRPRPALLERLLAHLGVHDDTARLVGATASLQLTWLATVAALAAGAVLVSSDEGSEAVFLVVAPLIPLAATAIAVLPASDPSGEAGIATPLHGAGVAVRRVLAVVLPTIAVLALLTPALPDGSARGAAWLLPSLALATTSLLLATVVRMPVAIGLAGFGWVAALVAVRLAQGRGEHFQYSAAFGAAGQVGAALVLAVAVIGLVLRRDRFATMEVGW